MKVQMEWLLFILIANLVSGFVANAQTSDGDYVVPGAEYMHGLNATGDIDDYEDMINATQLMEDVKPPTTGLDYVISTFTAVYNFFRMVSWLWDGFAQQIDYWAGYVASYGGITILSSLGNILRAVSAFMFATLIIELTRGVAILP